MALFCVSISSGYDRTSSVEPGFHQIWEADSEKQLQDDIWEERCQTADNHSSQEGGYYCQDCCNVSADYSECDTCGSYEVNSEWEATEAYGDFVETNSHSHYEAYDPNNVQHALCTSWSTKAARPEHTVAVAAKELEDIGRQVDRAMQDLVRAQVAVKDSTARVNELTALHSAAVAKLGAL